MIQGRLDHVAVAVADVDAAAVVWRARGAAPVSGGDRGDARTEQLRLGGGGKLELIGPSPSATGPTFVDAFLRRFGSGAVHHVTVKVPHLPSAIEVLAGAGLDVVDVVLDDDWWQEAFLRPSQVGGLVAQVAWGPGSDADWAARAGRPPPQPVGDDAPRLRGLRMGHPDLESAGKIWSVLGATVTGAAHGIVARWPDSPLAVEVVEAPDAGPIGLVIDGLPEHGGDEHTPPLVAPAG